MHDKSMSKVLRLAEKPAPDSRMARSRQALRTALFELLAEKPFDQIAITEITILAKVGYATFFRHYESKEELLNELAASEIENLFELTIPIFLKADRRESSRTLCAYVFQHRVLWRALLTGGAAAILRAEFVRQARSWAAKSAKMKTPIPADLALVCCAGSTIDALAWWLSQRKPMPVDDIADVIIDRIISPFLFQ
jgi:AcrR family transcriptional regulator